LWRLNRLFRFRPALEAGVFLFWLAWGRWKGSRRNLAEAFTDFRAAVLLDSGYKHLEVAEVFPHRRNEAEKQ
jgi:hypothetical protein